MVLMGITAMVSAIVVDKEKAREVWVGGWGRVICKEMNWRNEERKKKLREIEREKKKNWRRKREKKVGERNNNIIIFIYLFIYIWATMHR